jgi:hypothetical protein
MPNSKKVGTIVLDFAARRIGETPRGTAIDIQLKPTKRLKFSLDARKGFAGASGTILSWNDWVVVRRDMVAEFDGRGVVQLSGPTNNGETKSPSAVFSFIGMIDYASVVEGGDRASSEAAYKNWRANRLGKSPTDVPLSLALRFAGGAHPPDWAGTQFKVPPLVGTEFLFSSQFWVTGTAGLVKGDIASAKLDIWQI